MKKELLESYEEIRKIRQEIPNKIKHQDARDYLELVIKNNFLEAQNVQLLLNLQLQARTISQLKSMIMRQQRFIQENHLDSGESIAKVFTGKQFDELEGDEDYKQLLVASPSVTDTKVPTSEPVKIIPNTVTLPNPEPETQTDANIIPVDPEDELQAEETDPNAPQVEELVGIITGGVPVPEDSGIVVNPTEQLDSALNQENIVANNGKEDSKTEENKDISITGVSAFKIEGKSVGPTPVPAPSEKESTSKKQPAKSKSTKETLSKGKNKAAAEKPEQKDLSVMVF